jgi:molybdopterin-guanine dinucleotide biosynthesis protein B
VDLVLVEGFRSYDFPKIEIFRPILRQPPLWPQMRMMAVATDTALENCPHPVLNLNAPETVACFIIDRLALHKNPAAEE